MVSRALGIPNVLGVLYTPVVPKAEDEPYAPGVSKALGAFKP